MTKIGTKLSEEHKANIGKATRKMWENGIFDSDRIRNIWSKTALSGIAKKGRKSLNKFIPSQEMLDDYSLMGDKDLSFKWKVSRKLIVSLRKEYNLPRYNNQHGTKEHRFENGIEYKWCQKGHWELVEDFGANKTRLDGLRGWCKSCEQKNRSEMYEKNDGAKKARDYRKTESGKKSRSATMRKVWAKRRGNYIKFDLCDEERIYDLCDRACAYCKTPVGFDELEFDHFIPVRLGGMTEPSNMLPSCSNCNRGRGGKFDKDPYEWLMKRFGQHLGTSIYKSCIFVLESLK